MIKIQCSIIQSYKADMLNIQFFNVIVGYFIRSVDVPIHWVDIWWANGAVSPSNMSVVDRLDLKFLDYYNRKLFDL